MKLVDLKNDYADAETGKVDPEDLDARIDDLRDSRASCEEAGVSMDDGDAMELKMLLEFRAEVVRGVGVFSQAILIPDSEFERFVRWEAEQEFGIGPDNVGDYVDWAAHAENEKGWRVSVNLDDQVVWVSTD